MKSKTPTEARKDFYQLLKRVNSDHEPVYIEGKYDESNAVIIGMEDWRSINETI
ncbi:type II toxin-antitoxin system Phd/YefM family antitoxin, partial [Staphylococcus capitis]